LRGRGTLISEFEASLAREFQDSQGFTKKLCLKKKNAFQVSDLSNQVGGDIILRDKTKPTNKL
jgi:hypothetical protein